MGRRVVVIDDERPGCGCGGCTGCLFWIFVFVLILILL